MGSGIEYIKLYKDGPIEVKVLLAQPRKAISHSNASISLEGILSGETENCLIFDSTVIESIEYSTTYIRKDQIAVLYVLVSKKEKQ